MRNRTLSVSELKLFKACRQAWFLKYHEHLEPIEKSEALETGTSYHSKLEDLYNGELDVSDLSVASAMAKAYEKYIYPKFKVVSTEDWFLKELGNGFSLIGRTDGISDGCLVEHKTTGETNLEEYEFGLQWDEQILAYMYATGTREIWYTICRKPTIRIKKGETEEQFFNRMVEWYDEDTNNKIRTVKLYRTDEEVEKFRQHCAYMAVEIGNAAKAADDKSILANYDIYRNTAYCTKWGKRCEYAGICLDYKSGTEYAGYFKDERRIDYGNQAIEQN